jgi:hypothetical protein
MIKIIFRTILFIILTVLTQIGGVVFLLSFLIARKWKSNFRFKVLSIFIAFYTILTFIFIPIISPFFGREKIKNTKVINPTNFMTVLLNRNYVHPKLNELLLETENKLNGTNIEIHYLDANFPFINKFPLLPHLSHNDGKKIDLSLIYEKTNGEISKEQKSVSGYGNFEEPNLNEYNKIEECLKSGYFQYDYPKYLTLGKINSELVFSEKGTKKLIQGILENKKIGKLFIEPHLKNRMNLKDNRIKYHGCRAVRHDDHIHIQLK